MKNKDDEVRVGVFVILGFLILLLMLFFVSGVQLFRQGYHVNIMYDYVSILDRGAPVRMAGVRVGEVSSVDLIVDEKLRQKRVRVKLFIEKGIEIRENYFFKIQGTHILSEPHIEISPMPGEEALITGGEVLEGTALVPIENLIVRANGIASNLDDILAGFKDTLQNEENGQGLREILVNLAAVTKSLQIILGGSEQDMKSAISNIEATSESLKHLMDKFESGNGTVSKLFTEDELYEELREFVAEIKARPWRLLKKQ